MIEGLLLGLAVGLLVGYKAGHYEGLRCSCEAKTQHFIKRLLGWR